MLVSRDSSLRVYHTTETHDDPLYAEADIDRAKYYFYRIMYELRYLESEMLREGGRLYVNYRPDFNIELIDFSPELTKKILTIVRAIKW
jgi:hypothetical protein